MVVSDMIFVCRRIHVSYIQLWLRDWDYLLLGSMIKRERVLGEILRSSHGVESADREETKAAGEGCDLKCGRHCVGTRRVSI